METQQKHIKDFEESDSTKKVDISDEDKINIQKQQVIQMKQMRKNYLIKQILAGLCLLLTISLLISLTLSIGYQKFEIPKYRIINTQLMNNGFQYQIHFYGNRFYNNNPNSPAFKNITIRSYEDSNSELSLSITDQDSEQFHLPENQYFPTNKNKSNTVLRMYKYQLFPDDNTIFQLTNKQNDEKIFSIPMSSFVFTNLYSYFETSDAPKHIYGLGERRSKTFRYHKGSYTIFNKDSPLIDHGQPGQQTYGYHPMWLMKDKSVIQPFLYPLQKNFHVGFLKSTSPLQVDVNPGKKLAFHIIGGSIFLKFFIGNKNPETVIKAYHKYINGWSLHPFWSMGYHHSRQGYQSFDEMINIRDKFDDHNIPIDTMWSDLDYMKNYQDFELNENFTYEGFQALTNKSSYKGVNWVPLIDTGIAIHSKSAEIGRKYDVFLYSSIQKDKYLVGCQWPHEVYFPDFNHPNISNFWNESIYILKDEYNITPDGLWLDMNEFSNFIGGEKLKTDSCDWTSTNHDARQQVNDKLWLPYEVVGNSILSNKSITISTTHYDGRNAFLIPSQNTTELFFHPLNGYVEAILSHQVQRNMKNKWLTFTLSRSTFYGQGKYSQHWTGDNSASWQYLQTSIAEILPFQLFGIPMIGNNICGLSGNTTSELCARWMSLGAWFPFMRNHNDNQSISQEPFALDDYVVEISKQSIQQRYGFLKWMYSLFVRQCEEELCSGTVIRPIWWKFNNEEIDEQYENSQFMWGDELMVAGVFQEKVEEIKVYFPGNIIWYDLSSGQKRSQIEKVQCRVDSIVPVFLKSGSIVMRQKSGKRSRLLNNEFEMVIGLEEINKQGNVTLYQSYGQMMTLKDYEENNVYKQCLRKRKCIMEIYGNVRQEGNKVIGEIRIVGKERINWEEVQIVGISVYGLNEEYENKIILKEVQEKIEKNRNISFNIEL